MSLLPAERMDERIDIGTEELDNWLYGVELRPFVEIQGTTQVVVCAVGQKELDAGGRIASNGVHHTVHASLGQIDAPLVDGRRLYGVVERKRAGIFHKLIEGLGIGNRHIT